MVGALSHRLLHWWWTRPPVHHPPGCREGGGGRAAAGIPLGEQRAHSRLRRRLPPTAFISPRTGAACCPDEWPLFRGWRGGGKKKKEGPPPRQAPNLYCKPPQPRQPPCPLPSLTGCDSSLLRRRPGGGGRGGGKPQHPTRLAPPAGCSWLHGWEKAPQAPPARAPPPRLHGATAGAPHPRARARQLAWPPPPLPAHPHHLTVFSPIMCAGRVKSVTQPGVKLV